MPKRLAIIITALLPMTSIAFADLANIADEQTRRTSARAFTGIAPGAPIIVDTAPVWVASSGDAGRIITVSGERQVDLQLARVGAGEPLYVYVTDGAGNEAKLFLGPGRKTLTAAPGTLAQILRPDDEVFVVTALSGSVTEEADVNDPAPARDYTIITAGQSLARLWMLGTGLHGLQMGLRDLEWTPTIWPVQGATGGSGIIPAINATSYWWDPATGEPGPAALDWKAALDAIPPEQPKPDLIYWCFGQTDARWIGVEVSVEEYADLLRTLFAWMREQIDPQIATPIVISPVGSNEVQTPSPAQYTAVRWVELALIADDPNIHLGPSLYDLPRGYYDVHPTSEGQKLQGYRLAKTMQNMLDSGSNHLGPWVSQVEELSGGLQYRLTFELSQPGYAFTRNSGHLGIAVIPAGQTPLSASPAEIDSVSWSYANMRWRATITLKSAAPGATVVFPYGGFPEVNVGFYVRDVRHWRIGGAGFQNHQPLREFIGAAGNPPVVPVIGD